MLRFLLYIILFFLIYYFIKNLVIGIQRLTRSGRNEKHHKSRKKEGDVTIDYIPKKKKKKDQDENGEYIDYEEVK